MERKFKTSRMLKLISMLTILCISFSLFAGCAKTETASDEEPVATTEKTAEATKEAEKAEETVDPYQPIEGKEYEITTFVMQNTPVEEDAAVVKYVEDLTGVKLNVVNINQSQAQAQYSVKFASGEIPDVFILSGWLMNFQDIVKQGLLAEIPDEVVYKYLPKTVENLEKVAPDIMKYGKIDGVRYGIPNVVKTAGAMRRPFVYNGLWLKNLGVDSPPETFEEFEKLMYRFAKEDPDQNGKDDTYAISSTGMYSVFGLSGFSNNTFPNLDSDPTQVWAEKDGKAVCTAVQPEMKKPLEILAKWYQDGLIDPEFVTGENTGGYWAISHSFLHQRVGVTSRGFYYHWVPDGIKGSKMGPNVDEITKLNPEMAENLVYAQPPVGEDGKGGLNSTADAISNSTLVFGSHIEEEPDKMGKILEVVECIVSSDYKTWLTTSYGIEGEDWEFDEDGIVHPLTDMTVRQANGAGGGLNFVRIPGDVKFSEHRDYKLEWAYEEGFDQHAHQGVFPGLVVLPSASKYQTELSKLEVEAYISIITGEKPVSYFDEFVEKWNKAGGEQLTKEANEIYAELNK